MVGDLLVLGNCEHLVDEVTERVEQLLARSSGLTVLATSRERLGVPGEQLVHSPPLPLESDAERLFLFLDRPWAVDADFTAEPSVEAELCARLDGMPLPSNSRRRGRHP